MTPLETALSSLTEAVLNAVCAVVLSPAAIASRTRRTWVRSSERTVTLRWRAFSLVPMRLIFDLIFATAVLFAMYGKFRGGARARAHTQRDILTVLNALKRMRHGIEPLAVQNRSFAAHRQWVYTHNPIEPNRRRS